MSAHHAVLDALSCAIYSIDLRGSITSANRAAASRAARSSPLSGRPIWDALSDGVTREQLQRAMEAVRTGRSPVEAWEFARDAAAGERMHLLQVAPLRDETKDSHTASGAISGFVVSVTDLTTSDAAREARDEIGAAMSRVIQLDRVFHEVSQQLRRAVPHHGFVIALIDETSGEPRSVYRSGFEGDDSDAGPAMDARLRPHWLAAMADERVVAERGDAGMDLTAPLATGAGALGAITVHADGFEDAAQRGNATRVVSAIASQTAIAIERAALVRRATERRRLEAIGEVAAGIAHELRNPLFGISSAAQLLRFRAQQDPVVERNVGRILREVERLNAMVTDLLEFGRPRELALAAADPDAVLDTVIAGNRGLLERKSLSLQRSRSTHSRLKLDAERMAQVFVNLLVNAVDVAPPGTDIANASSTLSGGQWRCTISNPGAPIPADILPNVFEIFVSTKPGGTGIGLALCRRVIAEHGGTISVASDATNGTTVTVTLP